MIKEFMKILDLDDKLFSLVAFIGSFGLIGIITGLLILCRWLKCMNLN